MCFDPLTFTLQRTHFDEADICVLRESEMESSGGRPMPLNGVKRIKSVSQ